MDVLVQYVQNLIGLSITVNSAVQSNDSTTIFCNISEGEKLCIGAYYFCSFYFMTAITTSTGIGDLVPRHISEMIVTTVMMICIKFVVAVFLGEMSALVQDYTYSLVNYDHGILKLRVRVTLRSVL